MSHRFSFRRIMLLTGWSALGLLTLGHSGHVVPVHDRDSVEMSGVPVSSVQPMVCSDVLVDTKIAPECFEQCVEFAAGEMTERVLVALQGKYAAKRPLKVHSTLALALETGHRRRMIVRPMRPYLSDEEYDLACRWLHEAADQFDDLLQRRIAIMHLDQRESIPELLEYNDIATRLLLKKINGDIIRRIHDRRRSIRRAQRQAEFRRGY